MLAPKLPKLSKPSKPSKPYPPKQFNLTTMKIRLLIAVTLIIANSNAQPKVFIMDAERLVQLKKNVQQKDKTTLQLVDELKKQADAF